MDGWFNAKELMAALQKAIDFTEKHGDKNAYVMPHHEDDEHDRLMIMVGFDDGNTEFTGFLWDRKEPMHFPYVDKSA